MGEWRESCLGEHVEITNGFAFKSNDFKDEMSEGFMPVIKIKNVANGDVNIDGAQFHKFDERLSKYLVHRGDILIALTGNHPQAMSQVVGATSRYKLNVPALLNQRVAKINPKSTINADFLYFLMRDDSTYSYLSSQSSGSANQANISKGDVENIPITIPPLSEQKAISSVLSSLDDKIDLLHRQNLTLEALAESLFRHWFVGQAQEDWEDGTIADLVDFNPPRKLSKGQIAPYLEMASLSTRAFCPEGWYDREFSSGTKFINGDTLLARITPCLENGKAAYVNFLQDEQVGWGSTEYIVMRPKAGLHPFFAYILVRNKDFKEYAESCMEGSSGRQRVNISHLQDYDIKKPSDQAISGFNQFAESSVPKLNSNALKISILEKLRDTLLPKIMSGEVRVRING